MRRDCLQGHVAWLCVALHLSLSAGVSGLVLCVGEGGHVAIESHVSEACCDDARASEQVRLVAGDACGCTDVSLLQPAAGLRSSAEALLVALAPVSPSAAVSADRHPSARVRQPPGHLGRGSPMALRTVVLLV